MKGLPSCQLTPWRSGKVSSVPSSFHDQAVARSGRIESRLFCFTCWSNTTRLLNTPIIGPSATNVASSWSDMLAGLSGEYILRMPPAFWARTGPVPEMMASNAPITANAHRCRAISISSLFIATQPYDVWRRSHGRAVAARATCCTNGGLQAITHPIISTGWVRVHRDGFYGRESMGDRLKDKVALVSGAGSSGPGPGNAKATAVLFAREGAKVLAADLNLYAAVRFPLSWQRSRSEIGGPFYQEPVMAIAVQAKPLDLTSELRTFIGRHTEKSFDWDVFPKGRGIP